jgi:hypothetical protein
MPTEHDDQVRNLLQESWEHVKRGRDLQARLQELTPNQMMPAQWILECRQLSLEFAVLQEFLPSSPIVREQEHATRNTQLVNSQSVPPQQKTAKQIVQTDIETSQEEKSVNSEESDFRPSPSRSASLSLSVDDTTPEHGNKRRRLLNPLPQPTNSPIQPATPQRITTTASKPNTPSRSKIIGRSNEELLDTFIFMSRQSVSDLKSPELQVMFRGISALKPYANGVGKRSMVDRYMHWQAEMQELKRGKVEETVVGLTDEEGEEMSPGDSKGFGDEDGMEVDGWLGTWAGEAEGSDGFSEGEEDELGSGRFWKARINELWYIDGMRGSIHFIFLIGWRDVEEILGRLFNDSDARSGRIEVSMDIWNLITIGSIADNTQYNFEYGSTQ